MDDKTALQNFGDKLKKTKPIKKFTQTVNNTKNGEMSQFIKQNKHDNKAIDMNSDLNSFQKFGKKLGNTAKNGGKHLGNAIKNTDKFKQLAKKLKNLGKKLANIGKFIAANWLPIAIITGIIVTGIPLAEFIIGTTERFGKSPHMYCELKPDDSLKNTALYQQYCNTSSSMDFTNLNGHYVTQDGSGPCSSCATINMLLRYYASKGINLYDYMWNDTGQYNEKGQTVQSSQNTPLTLRKILNGNSSAATNSENVASDYFNGGGTKDFAAAHGKSGWTMCNWGYIRNEETYEDKAEVNPSDWVWDLSIDNFAPGSVWYSENEFDLTIENVSCHIKREESTSIERLKELLNGADGCVAEAGVFIMVNHTAPGHGHALLITDYDEATNEWKVVDSALYQLGGFEGVADESGTYIGITKGKPNNGVFGILQGNPDPNFSIQYMRYIVEN